MKTYISIIVPLFNEAPNLAELHNRIQNMLSDFLPQDKKYEVIFIDDGSNDNSFEILKSLHGKSQCVKVLKLRKRFGKTAAFAVGFLEAKGDIVVTIDGDLQNDPADIPKLVEKIDQGYDVVSGWRKERKDGFIKVFLSRIYNAVTSLFSGIQIHDFNCGLKAYKKQVLDEIEIYGTLHRYIPVIAHWKGFRIGEVEVKHNRRLYGKSKYGIARIFEGFWDLATVTFFLRFNQKPLHLFGNIGVIFLFFGLIINSYILSIWLRFHSIMGRHPLLILGVMLMILGVQLVSLGLLAEMIVNTSRNGKDTFSIKEKLERN